MNIATLMRGRTPKLALVVGFLTLGVYLAGKLIDDLTAEVDDLTERRDDLGERMAFYEENLPKRAAEYRRLGAELVAMREQHVNARRAPEPGQDTTSPYVPSAP